MSTPPLFAVRSKRFHDWLGPNGRSWEAIAGWERRGTWELAEAKEMAEKNNGYVVPVDDEEEPATPVVIDHEGEGRPWVKR